MKTNIIFYSLLAAVFSVWLYIMYHYTGKFDFGVVFMAVFETLITLLIIAALGGIVWRVKNGVDLFATLETDPAKVKSRMLSIMQYGHHKGIVGALNEFNDIFRNYPQWHLADWEVFRAWYKDMVDHALKYPKIYNLTMKDGTTYSKDRDPLYDPDAPDWAQFDRKYYYGDDDDDDEYTDDSPNQKKAAEDSFMIGVGFGVADNILDNNN